MLFCWYPCGIPSHKEIVQVVSLVASHSWPILGNFLNSKNIKTAVHRRCYSGGRTPIYREVRNVLCHIPGAPMPPKRNIGKSSHKECTVMLGTKRKCRKPSHKAQA